MSKQNCMDQCYAKPKLAEKEEEKANPQKEQPRPTEPQVATIAASDQKDAPQPQASPVAPSEQQELLQLCQRYSSFRQSDKRELWRKLYSHIGKNVKQGIYPLMPVRKGQCSKCRHVIGTIIRTEKHQENCRPEMYELGCPCGFLCSSAKSLAGHRGSCYPSSEIMRLGDQGWLPYISSEWRNCQLFDKIKIQNMLNIC